MTAEKGHTVHKLEYEKPVLTTLGRVRDLTAGGSMGGGEFKAGISGMPDTCDSANPLMTDDCLP